MTTLKCAACGDEKDLDCFYKADRKCKECRKALVKAARAKNAEHYKAFDKARANDPKRVAARATYAATPEGQAARIRARIAWQNRHPKQKYAHDAVSKAVSKGKLVKQPCFMCGSENVEAHHPDYDRPLDVVWLCVQHHKEIHFNE